MPALGTVRDQLRLINRSTGVALHAVPALKVGMESNKINIDQCVDLYGDMLYRYTLVRVRDADEAAEIVQNTFLAALQSQQTYAGRSSEKSWLYGILKHKILDHFRARKKLESFDLLDTGDPYENDFDATGHLKTPPAHWAWNPESATENHQLAQVLAKCLDGIAPKLRRIFVLKEIEGMTSEELCKEFDIQPNNLWVILHRTRNQLKKCLEIHWFQKP